jgi:hypothetical protein
MSEPVLFPVAFAYRENAGYESIDIETALRQDAEMFAGLGLTESGWDVSATDRDFAATRTRLSKVAEHTADCVLYWLGHGTGDDVEARLPTTEADSTKRSDGYSPSAMGDWVVERERFADGNWAVVVVNTCWSGVFARLAWSEALKTLTPRHVLLVGTAPRSWTSLDTFRREFKETLRMYFRAEPEVDLFDVFMELRRNCEYEVHGAPIVAMLCRQAGAVGGFTAPMDTVSGIEVFLSGLSDSKRGQLMPVGLSAEADELGRYFSGRAEEVGTIVDWLASGNGGVFVVTGAPGVGKSALLSSLLLLGRGELKHRPDLSERSAAAPVAFDAVVHLAGRTGDQVVDQVAEQLRLPPIAAQDPLAIRCAKLAGVRTGMTLLFDALDEAWDPLTVARDVIGALAARGFRILVGTRGSADPGDAQATLRRALTAPENQVLELTGDDGAASAYVRARLTSAKYSLFHANAVAAKLGPTHSFLDARYALHEILHDEAGYRSGRSAVDHFLVYLESVGGGESGSGALLTALAHAHGRGLPAREGLWHTLAQALADQPLPANAVPALLDDRRAAPYLALDSENGQTVYCPRTRFQHSWTTGARPRIWPSTARTARPSTARERGSSTPGRQARGPVSGTRQRERPDRLPARAPRVRRPAARADRRPRRPRLPPTRR